jgi:hypothetical protein
LINWPDFLKSGLTGSMPCKNTRQIFLQTETGSFFNEFSILRKRLNAVIETKKDACIMIQLSGGYDLDLLA